MKYSHYTNDIIFEAATFRNVFYLKLLFMGLCSLLIFFIVVFLPEIRDFSWNILKHFTAKIMLLFCQFEHNCLERDLDSYEQIATPLYIYVESVMTILHG